MSADRDTLFSLAGRMAQVVRFFTAFRTKYDVDCEATVIFLALGHLNFDGDKTLGVIKPSNIVALAGLTEISRETVRRKLYRLTECKLVDRHNHGFVVKDIATWRRLAEHLSDGIGHPKAFLDPPLPRNAAIAGFSR